MPKFQVESLIHINAVYLVEAENGDAAMDMVQDRLNVLNVAAATVELPDLETPSVATDAEPIGWYPEGVPIP